MSDTPADLDDLVARADPDRYVAALFAPAAARRGLIALYAFDHEVGRIAEIVREPMVGHIRLAWWRQQMDAIYAGETVHAPVVRALAEAVKAHGLPRDFFDRYLDARARDFEAEAFEDEAAMAAHAEAVSAGVVRLAARVLGADGQADGAALQAGVAMAYARHAAGLAADARLRHCRLPMTWLREAGLGAEDVFAAQATPALTAVVLRLAKAGEGALGKLAGGRFPTRATPALSPATMARPYLRAVRSPNFDPFRAAPPTPQWLRVARIAFATLTWRI
jgi:phytoene/squalene synthetase